MSEVTLTCSLADQNFARTKTVGVLNLSVHLTNALASSGKLARVNVLANHSLDKLLNLPRASDVRHFDRAAGGGLSRVWWDQMACYSAAAATTNDWLLLPKGFASFLRKPPVRLAVYVHDAMHDFYSTRFPGVTPRMEEVYFTRSLGATLRHAELVFTNSEFTRTEVLRLAKKFGVREPRVIVAGIGFEATKPRATEKADPVMLLTGGWPHKRTEVAIPWLRQWRRESGFSGEIHCVGALPPGVNIPGENGWQHHHRLSHDDYNALVRSARAVVYFSEYEGFGMPPVEATLAGACPVFSSLPATREVMGDAGAAFSNDSFESFSRAMNAAFQTAPEVIAAWREELLQRHNWTAVVDRVVNALATAAPSR